MPRGGMAVSRPTQRPGEPWIAFLYRLSEWIARRECRLCMTPHAPGLAYCWPCAELVRRGIVNG